MEEKSLDDQIKTLDIYLLAQETVQIEENYAKNKLSQTTGYKKRKISDYIGHIQSIHAITFYQDINNYIRFRTKDSNNKHRIKIGKNEHRWINKKSEEKSGTKFRNRKAKKDKNCNKYATILETGTENCHS